MGWTCTASCRGPKACVIAAPEALFSIPQGLWAAISIPSLPHVSDKQSSERHGPLTIGGPVLTVRPALPSASASPSVVEAAPSTKALAPVRAWGTAVTPKVSPVQVWAKCSLFLLYNFWRLLHALDGNGSRAKSSCCEIMHD